MFQLNRRRFLGTSFSGMAAGCALGGPLLAQETPAAVAAARDALFLTWFRDPTTSVVIQWVGAEPAQPLDVQYQPLAAANWQYAKVTTHDYPGGDMKVHRCELEGLAPGTEYQFQIGTDQAAHRFRTMPSKATNTIQFVSGGDCGIDAPAILTNQLAARQDPYFALIGGDLAYDNGVASEKFLTFLRNYSQHMMDPQGRMIPMVTCIGNHEVNKLTGPHLIRSPHYMSFFDGFFKETSFGVLDIGDYMSLVLLDTGHLSPIAGAQTDWLGTVLAARQSRTHLIVANHVPAYPSFRAPEGKDGEPGAGELNRLHWSPLFEKYNVDVVLEHHDHTFKRTHPMTGGLRDKHDVLYLGDGSWGKLRVPNTPEQRPYLAAVSQAYHMTVHRLEGEQRFHVAIDSTGRVADVCTTINKRAALRG